VSLSNSTTVPSLRTVCDMPKRYSIGITCRCPICGANSADTNHIRNSYIRVGITRDGPIFGKGKVVSRRLRRTRERNIFQQELRAI
jgi:hypothetical protein